MAEAAEQNMPDSEMLSKCWHGLGSNSSNAGLEMPGTASALYRVPSLLRPFGSLFIMRQVVMGETFADLSGGRIPKSKPWGRLHFSVSYK